MCPSKCMPNNFGIDFVCSVLVHASHAIVIVFQLFLWLFLWLFFSLLFVAFFCSTNSKGNERQHNVFLFLRYCWNQLNCSLPQNRQQLCYSYDCICPSKMSLSIYTKGKDKVPPGCLLSEPVTQMARFSMPLEPCFWYYAAELCTLSVTYPLWLSSY